MALERKNRLALVFVVLSAIAICYLFYLPGFPIAAAFDPASAAHQIVFELRVPRLLFVLAIGGALSALGGAFQVLFKNALAEPYVLGVSSAVSLVGAVLFTQFQLPLNSLPMGLAGCLAGILVSLFLLGLGRVTQRNSTDRLILFGMSLNFVLSSLLFLYLTYASQQLGGGTMQWLFGHLPWVSLERGLFYFFVSFAFLLLWVFMGRSLDAMALGDSVARTLGVSPETTRWVLVLSSSLFLGIVVTQTGAIGFVGLVVPHATRLLFSPRSSRSLFLFSFLLGGFFLLFCDFWARQLLPPMEFPIGVVTTLVGAPIFLWLLWKR